MRIKDFHNSAKQIRIKTENAHNLLLTQRLKVNLGRKLGKNLLDKLVRLIQKLVKLVIETISKVHKLKIYNKAINNLINKNKWQKVIDKEFWNLNSY